MDGEGFSGVDGRTTIFDYWCVDSLRKGYYSRKEMSKEEKALEKVYSQVLNIAVSEKAVTDGVFYDLMYANQQSEAYNASKIYSFFRKEKKEAMLVVVNFSEEKQEAMLTIPAHAFEFLGIVEGEKKAVNLLSGKETVLSLSSSAPTAVSVPPLSALILKFAEKK